VKAVILTKPSFAKMENSAVVEIVNYIESKEYPPNYGKNEKRLKINVTSPYLFVNIFEIMCYEIRT